MQQVEIMGTSTADLLKQALDLNEKDRAMLAGILIESLEEKPDEDLDAVWRAEVAHRVSELESGDIKAISWDEVKTRLMQKNYGQQDC